MTAIPGLATAGVLAGGLFNVFGDYIFVFTFDMGIYGAGLATAIGSGISFFVMLSHFWSKKNTLAFQKPARIFSKLKEISVTGFSTFFIDVAMGILTVLFNRQIMKYLGTSALAIYGPIVNVSTFVQCCAYSVGQASQPIISINFGARYGQRIKDVLRYALYTVAVFSVFWTALSLICPNLYIYIFMKPTTEILEMAPAIIRCLWTFLYFTAAQHFFYLLLSGADEAESGIYRVCCQRLYHQRYSDHGPPRRSGSRFYLACHAGYRAGSRCVCGAYHCKIHKKIIF